MLVEELLQVFHLGTHGFFGVCLHSGVDGCVDFEPVTVQVVGFSFGIDLGFDPLTKFLPQVFPEIGGGTGCMALRTKIQGQGEGLVTLANLGLEKIIFDHLGDDGIAPVQGPIFVPNRGIIRGSFEQTHQQGGLMNIQGFDVFVEIGSGG